MRASGPRHAAVILAAVTLTACAGPVATSPEVAGPAPAATASSTPGATPSKPTKPPLVADLAGGTPVQLGPAGHYAIVGARAFVADPDGTVTALDLGTGLTAWQAQFTKGTPWDARPTVGLSADGRTVVAVRTVDVDSVGRLDVLLIDAATGTVQAEHVVGDSAGKLRVDLPPLVVAADQTTIVLADNPESGRQTAVVRTSDGVLAWVANDQAVGATSTMVITRSGGRDRAKGTVRWKAFSSLGPLVARRGNVVVVRQGTKAVWLSATTGRRLALTGKLSTDEPTYAATRNTVVYLTTAGLSGRDLATGKRLWHRAGKGVAVVSLLDWAYVWRKGTRGDVLSARTGKVLVKNKVLPSILYANDAGVLLNADDGYRWVSF